MNVFLYLKVVLFSSRRLIKYKNSHSHPALLTWRILSLEHTFCYYITIMSSLPKVKKNRRLIDSNQDSDHEVLNHPKIKHIYISYLKLKTSLNKTHFIFILERQILEQSDIETVTRDIRNQSSKAPNSPKTAKWKPTLKSFNPF